MRILLVSDLFPPVSGGLENHVDGLATEFASGGDDVAVATLTLDPQPTHDWIRAYPIRSLAHHLPRDRVDRPFHPPVPEPASRAQLRRVVRDFRPDIIHGHSWLTVALGRVDVPVVHTAHDYGLVCQLRTLLRPDGSQCSGPRATKCVTCGAHTYGPVTSSVMAPATVLGRRVFPADRILAVSGAVRRALQRHTSIPIDVVPNFVTARTEPEPLPSEVPEGPFALYAGDDGDHKGVPDLLEVWRAHHPGLPLVLATPNSRSRDLPVDVVPVSLSRGQMVSAWTRAAFGVVPSRWGDPCPTVVLEAMQAGRPVVASNTGGIPDLVRNREEGLLVPPRDPVELGRAIAMLAKDDELRTAMGTRARTRADDFSASTVSRRIRATYELMIAEGRADADRAHTRR